mmetsp:Transcript_160942/g.516553  ORF Transcript_160942/g.516553 Transcript_160942/m.516553 type:complete len:226 (-) Transcript_160942:61-738(-)
MCLAGLGLVCMLRVVRPGVPQPQGLVPRRRRRRVPGRTPGGGRRVRGFGRLRLVGFGLVGMRHELRGRDPAASSGVFGCKRLHWQWTSHLPALLRELRLCLGNDGLVRVRQHVRAWRAPAGSGLRQRWVRCVCRRAADGRRGVLQHLALRLARRGVVRLRRRRLHRAGAASGVPHRQCLGLPGANAGCRPAVRGAAVHGAGRHHVIQLVDRAAGRPHGQRRGARR